MQSVLKNDDARAELWGRLLLITRPNLMDHIQSLWRGPLRWILPVEDVFQETCVELWRLHHRFHGSTRDDFLAWSKRIAEYTTRNLARAHMYQKRSKRRLSYLEELGPSALKEPLSTEAKGEDLVDIAERKHALQLALSELSAVEVRLIDLVYLRDISVGEVAEGLGISTAAVRKRLARSFEKLHSQLRLHPEYRELFPEEKSAPPRRLLS
jgi:RNA polymerase sigma-70 factor (ECF subfamily)